jgi:parallel beta-helix repeat protein
MRKLVIVSSAAVALALCAPALAAEGRIPIWAPTSLVGPGTDGKYIVTRNVAPPGGSSAIFVSGTGTEEIDIDLDGKTLFGDPLGAASIVDVSNVGTLVLRNGSVRAMGPPAGGDSVRVSNVQKVIIEDLRIEGGGAGIHLLAVSNFAVRRNVVVSADPFGIWAESAGNPVPMTGFIQENLVKDSTLGGIELFDNHSSVSIDHNRVDRTLGGAGISLVNGNACKVAENTVEQAAGIGIQLQQVRGCKVYNNVVAFSGFHGIAGFGSSQVLYLDNTSTGNGGTGLWTDGAQNRVEQNVLNGNTACGLHLLGPDNTYGKNTARANAGGPPCGPCAAAPFNVCPFAGGAFPPELCIDGPANTSFCDNLMPGPPTQ